ncbi:putative replication factor-a protein [Stachybotrys elegans]|uniref:Replication factor-a protein n=1 Tax=Stachybotrys elegans TaxID=80388 RepID=A0A8K0T0H1_9HYPO|nr:putative replication factor-a protein [Stachybotrys elegans]
MAAYGGYSRGGNESGGFFAGDSQQGSQGGGGGRDFNNQTLRPLTIKQVLDAEESPDAKFHVDGEATSQVTIIGQVRRSNPQATHVSYRIDDGTGQIDVQRWIPPDKKDQPIETFDNDSFVRVFGFIKVAGSRRSINADHVRAVTDFNEVNYHLLEATYVHLQKARGLNGADPDQDSMFVDGGGGVTYGNETSTGDVPPQLSGCSPAARKLYMFLKDAPGGNEGIHLNVITGSANMSVRDVLTGADELLSQGMIFTTVDEETWAILQY